MSFSLNEINVSSLNAGDSTEIYFKDFGLVSDIYVQRSIPGSPVIRIMNESARCMRVFMRIAQVGTWMRPGDCTDIPLVDSETGFHVFVLYVLTGSTQDNLLITYFTQTENPYLISSRGTA